jgi:hypothetical protein
MNDVHQILPTAPLRSESWKLLLETAKTERDAGNEERALRLYKSAIIIAAKDEAVSKHTLCEFLTETFWCGETEND